MEKFLKYDIKPNVSESNVNFGQFNIGPLERGFGVTIGNSLRRVLLSNIPGASVFAIKIPGVTHEFQAIEGIKEDVTQIVLNLKKLLVKIDNQVYSDEQFAEMSIETWPSMKINFDKSGVINASSIEVPVGFEIVNKDLYIATKTDSKKPFVMEIYAKTGRGFKSFKQNHELINSLSIIATDSNFSPIIQVSYAVEEQKITKTVVGDILKLEIATDGTISPGDALAYASKILMDHFEDLTMINEKIKQVKMMNDEVETAKQQSLSIPIEDLDLSVRSYNCLKRNGIQTIQELTIKSRSEIEKIKNLGKKSLREIQKKLVDYGLAFKEI